MTTTIISILVLAFLFLLSFLLPSKKEQRYGTAELQKTSKSLSKFNKGFKIGKRSLSVKDSTQHLMCIASSGGSKTQSIVLPTIYQLAKKQHSLVCLDYKGELTSITSGYLAQRLGVLVHVLNLIHPHKSICWNPLEGLDNFESLVADMYDIANNGNQKTESIWRYNTIDLIVQICRFLNQYNKGKNLNLVNLLRLLKRMQSNPKQMQSWFTANCEDDELIGSFRSFFAVEEKIKQGILSGATATIIPFAPKELSEISSRTTLPDINTFRHRQSCLFITLPLGREMMFLPYITLLNKRLFDRILNSDIQKNSRHIAFILDEFGQMCISGYPSIVSTVRSKKIMLMHILQNFEQLSYRYDHNVAHIIASNCKSWVLLPGIKSEATLRFVSETLMGKTTHVSQDGQITSRLLMNKDEVRRMKSGSALFISGTEQPSILKLKPLYKKRYLKWIYKLKSEEGRLVSAYQAVEHANNFEVQLISFDDVHTPSKTSEEEILDFKEQLERLLPKQKKP